MHLPGVVVPQGTKSHYVRCIKPNDLMRAGLIGRNRVVEQLKCAGVLEVVRLSRAGYPYRLTHADFFFRYRPCLSTTTERRMHLKVPRTLSASSAGDQCMQLMDALTTMFAFNATDAASAAYAVQKGRTKIFLSKDTYNQLEGARARLVYESSTRIQALCRGHRYRTWFKLARVAGRVIRAMLRRGAFRRCVGERILAKRALLKRMEEARVAREAAERLAQQERAAREQLEAEQQRQAQLQQQQQQVLKEKESAAAVAATKTPLKAQSSVKLQSPAAESYRGPVITAAALQSLNASLGEEATDALVTKKTSSKHQR